MKTQKEILLAIFLTLGSLTIHAQQTPMYTHYMYNTLGVNPAYAGSRDALTVTALHRSQWVGFNDAPITQTLTMHSPLYNEHIGVGLSLVNDKIGPTNNTSVYAYYAYRVNLTERAKLAFGLSAGASMFNANLSSVELDQQADPVFQNDIVNHVSPNFGFGVYYSRERFYAGLSIPFLLQNNYTEKYEYNKTIFTNVNHRHYFFIAGTLINISDNLAFKPTTLVKMTPAAPIQLDLTTSFVIMKKLLIGAMYRTGDSFGGLVGLNINDQLHLGYSYDWSHGLETGKYNSGSHEIVLRYDFIFSSKKQIRSHKYF